MKKRVFCMAVLFMILIYGCAQTTKEETLPKVEDLGPGAEIETSPEEPIIEPEASPELSGEVKEFEITAKQWEFTPNPIEVNKGDTIRLKITSIDVTHGIAMPDFGISERLEPNKEVIVEFVADKQGEFTFYCNVPCGAGHRNMRGKLIVR